MFPVRSMGFEPVCADRISIVVPERVHMAKYKVTQKTFGLGFASATAQTTSMEEHINAHATKGWELIQADKSPWEIPVTWRFIWKLPNDQGS